MKQKYIYLNISAGGAVVKNPSANAGDTGLFPGLGRSVGEGNPRQSSCLGNTMDRGAWRATVHGATRVGHDLATKKTATKISQNKYLICIIVKIKFY